MGQRYGLTMQEFGHFLHYLKVCNFKTSEDIVGAQNKLVVYSYFVLFDYLIFLFHTEDIFFKTGNVSGSAAGAATTSSKFNSSGRWPLMTRAHLAQAVIFAALLEKEENATVSFFPSYGSDFTCSVSSLRDSNNRHVVKLSCPTGC